MKIVDSMPSMQRRSAAWVRSGETVGFVPTMGALHEGHLTLIRRARRECQRVVVSIYVNPTQFSPTEDLAKYPRPREQDLALCRKEGVDLVFAPRNLYQPDHSTYVEETKCSLEREGAIRPGHFRGVATVVLKLFNLVRPTKAYFGQKDAQQVEVIERMVRDLDVPLKIIVVPIVRDADGVALSSRNIYLSPEERKVAAEFARLLQHAARKELHSETWLGNELKKVKGLHLDYADQVGHRLVVAVKVGNTRLLDNELIRTLHQPEGFMIRTRSRLCASICFAHFKTAKLKAGEHIGIACINGSPIEPDADVRKLLRDLQLFKKKSNGICRLTVTENTRRYRIEGRPPLHAEIKMKKSGDSIGKLFVGSRWIGQAVIFANEDDPLSGKTNRRRRS